MCFLDAPGLRRSEFNKTIYEISNVVAIVDVGWSLTGIYHYHRFV